MNDKNPSVKSETILFLARCFQQCTPAMLPKPFLKVLCPVIVEVRWLGPDVRGVAISKGCGHM